MTSTFYSGVSRIFSTSANLAVILLISRCLGTGSLGLYGICFTLFYLFYTLTSLNLETYAAKEVAIVCGHKKGSFSVFNQIINSSLLGFAFGLPFLLIFFRVYRSMDPFLLGLTFAAGVLLGIERNLAGMFLGAEKMHLEVVFNLIASLILVLPLLIGSFSIREIFWLRIIGYSVAIAGKVLFILPETGLWKWRFLSSSFREIKYFWFEGIIGYVARQADVFVLSLLVGKVMLGSYFLSLRVFLAFSVVSEIVSRGLVPFFSRSFAGKEELNFSRFLRYSLVFSLVVGVVLGAVLFAGSELIVQFFKNSQPRTLLFLRLLALLVPFRMVQLMSSTVLSSTGFQKNRFFLQLGTSLFFLFSVTVLALMWDARGALAARLAGELVASVASCVMLRRSIRSFRAKAGSDIWPEPEKKV